MNRRVSVALIICGSVMAVAGVALISGQPIPGTVVALCGVVVAGVAIWQLTRR